MSVKMRIGGVARALCVLLAEALVFQSWPLPLRAQEQEPAKLVISILEGEGSINNIRQRVARESMVQVEDENHKPIAGAAVTFLLPGHGASGAFVNGGRSLTVMTDNAGRAVAQVVPNKVAGDMPIHVAAKFHTLEANTVIHAQNAALAGGAAGAAGGAAISGKLLAVILIAAGGIAGGVIAATRGGGSSPATITAGTPTVGAPR